MIDQALVDQFAAIVGPNNALRDQADIAPHLVEWRGQWTGKTNLVLKPASTAEVSSIAALANENGIGIVPQGGNTGLVGGQIPDSSGSQIIVSLSRMNTIRTLDREGRSLIVEAGATLQSIQDMADEAGLLFPLSLASQGTAHIGGNIATNAGGTGALAYGVARDLVLGLEVVLADGRVLDDLSILKKDNTGYALRHLFIGSEGTLGIITAASLKLFSKPKGFGTLVASVANPHDALAFLNLAQTMAGPQLTSFELMADAVTAMAVQHVSNVRFPLALQSGWSVLAEVSSLASEEAAQAIVLELAEHGLETELIADAVLAQNLKQRADFWRLRESLSEAQRFEGVSIKHDIAIPVHAIPTFIAKAEAAASAIVPQMRFCTFGHMGDGNLHYNISQPVGMNADAFGSLSGQITAAIHELVRACGGSISAEHGIGQMKRAELAATKSPVALDLMRQVKASFDPNGIMNPGKLL